MERRFVCGGAEVAGGVGEVKDKDFETEVFLPMIKKLGKRKKYRTKTKRRPNWVKIEGDSVRVKTIDSGSKYIPIPHWYFVKTWKVLFRKKFVRQQYLKKSLDIRHAAFLMIAFDLLDFVKYSPDKKGLVLEQRK